VAILIKNIVQLEANEQTKSKMPYKDIEQRRKKDREYHQRPEIKQRQKEYNKRKYHKCIDCDKLIVPNAKRCNSCYIKDRQKKGYTLLEKHKKILSKRMKINNPMKNPKIANKVRELNIKNGGYEKNRVRMLNGGAMKARMNNNFAPNKPERVVLGIIKDKSLNFVYTGGGSKWLKGDSQYFNPDFTNYVDKLIIEVFGKYWHSNYDKKDKERIETYKKYGYRTLIIWDFEIKNKEEIIKKILSFVRGNIKDEQTKSN